MKRSLAISFTALIFMTRLSGQVPDSLKYISVPAAAFKQAMDTSRNVMLIDVREYFEFKKSRIRGAVNIPSSGNLKTSADTIDKNRSLFLYCTSGFRSKRAAKGLYDEGFRKPYSLDGGINGWKKEGFPIDRKKMRKK
jgi:rhodanese-related sulfurtransferase